MPKDTRQSNVLLDEQAKKNARAIAARYGLNGMSAAIRYALHEVGRGLRQRRGSMKRVPIQAMSAKELLSELEALRSEREDFDTLEVYVDVITRRSYEEEKAWDGEGEFTEDCLAEGSAFEIVVPTGYDMSGEHPEPIGDYILIRSVELDD